MPAWPRAIASSTPSTRRPSPRPAVASDPATIRLERGDRTATLWQVGAGADGKFEGQNVDLVRQGANVKVNWLDVNSGKTDALDCKPR